jgi:hypothetical protein
MLRHLRSLSIGLCVLFYSGLCFAWPPTYGAELEFTDSHLEKNGLPTFRGTNPSESAEKQTQMKWVHFMTQHCLELGCQVTEVKGKWDTDYKIVFADGWWFKISYDPSCVEITFKPTALKELESRKEFINQVIYESASKAGVFLRAGKNFHFNIGFRSAFDDDTENFLRFFVDYANHPDWSLGSLGRRDLNNAPPLSVLTSAQSMVFSQIIEDFYKGRITHFLQMPKMIQTEVYTSSYNSNWGGPAHYQAIGLKYVNKMLGQPGEDAPFEIRSAWYQENSEKFILFGEFIEARINFQKKQKGKPIIYIPLKTFEFSPQQLKTRFLISIYEMNEKPEKFINLLPEHLRTIEPSPLFQDKASTSEKIQDLKNYEDVLMHSDWLITYTQKLLKDPQMAADFKANLKKSAEAWIEKVPFDTGEKRPNPWTPLSLFAKSKGKSQAQFIRERIQFIENQSQVENHQFCPAAMSL